MKTKLMEIKLFSDKVNVREIMSAMNKKDIRAALRWCKQKNLLVIKFGKERYVNLMDFELAIDRPFIESLKIKHPLNWQELYAAYKRSDYQKITELTVQKEKPIRGVFIPPGPEGRRFLEKLKNRRK